MGDSTVWFNSIITWLLRSPMHGLVSRILILLTVTGRKSGRSISTPTNYIRQGDTLWVISWRQRTWWRNLRGGAIVRVLLSGKNLSGTGQVVEEEKAVAQSLFAYYRLVPGVAKYVHIGLDLAGQPILADCELAAHKMVVVRIELD
jgi:deazaflavin-dependent oxidoreductase (nitroreductase family)